MQLNTPILKKISNDSPLKYQVTFKLSRIIVSIVQVISLLVPRWPLCGSRLFKILGASSCDTVATLDLTLGKPSTIASHTYSPTVWWDTIRSRVSVKPMGSSGLDSLYHTYLGGGLLLAMHRSLIWVPS